MVPPPDAWSDALGFPTNHKKTNTCFKKNDDTLLLQKSHVETQKLHKRTKKAKKNTLEVWINYVEIVQKIKRELLIEAVVYL